MKLRKEIVDLVNLGRPVLLTGETGVGKTYLAQDAHRRSDLKKLPFVSVNLASLSESLFTSELFGHRKGSFTGAFDHKDGLVKKVGLGVLFLDEIGELSLDQQKKLLLLLDQKVFVPVGGETEEVFKGTLIVATNRSLTQMVASKEFRADLYYRLGAFEFNLPSLRQSPARLENLLWSFFHRYQKEFDQPDLTLAPNLLDFLLNYRWPGNIRELKHTMEYLCFKGKHIATIENLPSWIPIQMKSKLTLLEGGTSTFKEAMESFENHLLYSGLVKNKGKVNVTAAQLGINRTTFIAKLKKYGISAQEIKATSGPI